MLKMHYDVLNLYQMFDLIYLVVCLEVIGLLLNVIYYV